MSLKVVLYKRAAFFIIHLMTTVKAGYAINILAPLTQAKTKNALLVQTWGLNSLTQWWKSVWTSLRHAAAWGLREVSKLSFTTPFCHSVGIYCGCYFRFLQNDKERVLSMSFSIQLFPAYVRSFFTYPSLIAASRYDCNCNRNINLSLIKNNKNIQTLV